MEKPKIYRFEVRNKYCTLTTKRFVEFTEYERLDAKYKELWESYMKLQNKWDKHLDSD